MRTLTMLRCSSRRGQALMEFALVLPLFILLVMIIVDFGRAIWTYNAISNMAREGARYGIISTNDEPSIYNRAKALAPDNSFQNTCNGSVPNRICVTLPSPRTPPGQVVVDIHYRFVPITPLIANLIGGNGYIDMAATSKMTVEY